MPQSLRSFPLLSSHFLQSLFLQWLARIAQANACRTSKGAAHCCNQCICNSARRVIPVGNTCNNSGCECPAPGPDASAPAPEALVDPPQHGGIKLPGEARAQDVVGRCPAQRAVVLEILALLKIEV